MPLSERAVQAEVRAEQNLGAANSSSARRAASFRRSIGSTSGQVTARVPPHRRRWLRPPTARFFFRALFFRSITELQFMGFIKPTNRKVDHVVKLTNGSSLLTIDDFNYKIQLNYH